jgi:8-oxo-dGTP pyrophosphatase MutT (NUDIX family)
VSDPGAAAGGPAWLSPLVAAVQRVDAAELSRFLPPEDGSGRASAVLIALRDGPDGPAVLLIARAADMRAHAGQVAFPGGAIDPDDADAPAAAPREANEEVGLDPATVRIVAQFPALFIPVTGYVVTPVLAWWRRPHPVAPVDPVEVAHVAVVPIAELADPANRFRVSHPSGLVGPGFTAAGLFVWGFTAGLLDRVLTLGGWARPWDPTRVEALPTRLP